MAQWRVRDVMTTDVITVLEDTPVTDVAAALTRCGISAVPVVDRFDVVVGLVSWTDLHHTIDDDVPDESVGPSDDARSEHRPATRWWLRLPRPRWSERRQLERPRGLLRWAVAVAADLMTAVPVTIDPGASLAAAGRVMHRRRVSRLLVVDGQGRLAGIVTRGDLLTVHSRLDAVIRDEVVQRVLRRTLGLPSTAVRVGVDDGVVTLAGRVRRRTTARAAVELARTVPGVTDVIDRLTVDTGAVVAATSSR